MATLPTDIIFSYILPKVHTKSLHRFKCVSRSFLTEILSSKFIQLQHLNALSSNDNNLFILQKDTSKLYVCDLDSPLSAVYYPIHIAFTSALQTIVAYCECYFIAYGYSSHNGHFLVNPSTRTYRELPLAPVTHNVRTPCNALYGMCHCLDEFNDDYKVVRFTGFKNVDGCVMDVVIYSLRTNSWKVVECEPTDEVGEPWHNGTPVLVQNHLLHMIFSDVNGRMTRIGCFDIKAEKWANDVLFPDVLLGECSPCTVSKQHKPYLGVLDGQLYYLDPIVMNATCDLWVMKEYGIKESWVKLMSLGIQSNTWSPWHGVYHPVASRKGSPHELLCRRGISSEYFWYNLRSKKGIKADIDGIFERGDSLALICKGSLLNFSGGQPIRTSFADSQSTIY